VWQFYTYLKIDNGLNEHYKSNVKTWYFESHKSLCKLSLEIHYIKEYKFSLFDREFKFEIWISKLLFSLKKGLNGERTIIQDT